MISHMCTGGSEGYGIGLEPGAVRRSKMVHKVPRELRLAILPESRVVANGLVDGGTEGE